MAEPRKSTPESLVSETPGTEQTLGVLIPKTEEDNPSPPTVTDPPLVSQPGGIRPADRQA